jgi:hypothetical protein
LRLVLEQLEDRLVPSNFTAATASDLIADINAANQGGGSNTIALVAGKSFTLTAVNNTTDGGTGLPVIAANDNLTIVGNGDTIARSTASGTPAFRLIDVASGATLTLQNLTLQGGLAFGSGVSAEGGGIYNQGTIDFNGVTVQNNTAQGGVGYQSASGGGIWSNGALTLEGGTTLQNNRAVGAAGAVAYGGGVYIAGGTASLTSTTLFANTVQGGGGVFIPNKSLTGGYSGPGADGLGGGLYVAGGGVTLTGDTLASNAAQGGQGFGRTAGGSGLGGALYVTAGTVTLSDDTLSANTAVGGNDGGGVGSNGGNGLGGGLYAAGGTVTLVQDAVTGNRADGGARGPRGNKGLGEGGGLYIASAATVSLDAYTVADVFNNTASTSHHDIYGPYIVT